MGLAGSGGFVVISWPASVADSAPMEPTSRPRWQPASSAAWAGC